MTHAASAALTVQRHSGSAAAWNGAVPGLAGATHCHLAGWLEVIGASLGHETVRLQATDPRGSVVGLLPLAHVRSRLLGNYLVSLPFLNAGGPIGTPEGRAALAEAAVREAEGRGAVLELRDRYERAPGRAPTDRKITVTLDLPDDPDVLLRSFSGRLRKNIGKPKREGMEFRAGPDQVPAFWEVLSRNMRDLGTPVLPLGFFEAIAAAFPDSAIFGALYHQGRPVGCQCSFVFGETLEMVWGSTVREYNSLKPSSYITWAYMELAIARGCRVFDFGRCTPDSGTHRFKQQWGGTDVALPWSHWAPGGADAAPPSPDRPLFRLAVRGWQRLPLAVANRLGPRIARFLP